MIKRRILIVDDIEDNILLIEDCLKRELNCEFRKALSGYDALKILEVWKPDCILMDIMMPGMDGIESTKRIKEIPEFQDIPILMVTAKQELDSFEEAFDKGAVDYIYKPVDRITLLVRVKSALRNKEDLDRIKELNKELFQKKQELSSFSHTVSHDLKSPLVGAASLYDFFIYRLKKEHPKININLHTNMGGGKDETFLKVIQHPNVNIVAGVDGLRDNCSTYRRGSSWKTLEKRFKMIKDHAPNRHHWKMLDFDFNRHQQKEAIELSKKYKFHSMLISPPYGESNNTVNEMILEFENKERTEKGKKRIKYQQRDSIKTLHTFKEAETDITYDEFFAKKENQKMKRNIDTKMNTVKTGRTHSCPWQQATSIQVMSNGTVWPCCWSSDMNKLFEMYPDKVSKKIFYYSQNIELQYTAQDWSVKLGKDWQSNIQVSQNNSLADIMYSKSYKRLKRLLEPRKDKYNIKYCTSACTIFSEKESTGGKLLSRTTDDKDKTDIIITHSGNNEYVWGKVYPIKK